MQEKSDLDLETLKQTITIDFQNIKDIVNGMAKSILAFTQAKIDISRDTNKTLFLMIFRSY